MPSARPDVWVRFVLLSALPIVFGTVFLAALSSGDETLPNSTCVTITDDIDRVLRTIRALESGGDYTAQSRGSTASGAYQFLDSTWARYGGYARAADAPPSVQDAKAAENVALILTQHDGDVSAVPVVWYIGRVPAAGSAEWDRVPAPEAGNRLTPREYQTRWLRRYDTEEPAVVTTTTVEGDSSVVAVPGGCIGGSTEPLPGGWSLPGPRALIDADPSVLSAPHHTYPAWDWIIPENTPIYAVRGGRVVAIRSWPLNWWTAGCGTRGGGACSTCGVGLTIEDAEGIRWTYCHGTNVTVTLGAEVTAGTQIMWSGNTGRSGTPHLHLEIRVNGERRCPQALIDAIHRTEVIGAAASLLAHGCTF